MPAAALLAADPSAAPRAARGAPDPGANVAAVERERIGAPAAPATGAVGRGVPLVAVLRSILRAVAIVDGLVCLYALIQACALTVQERRRTIAVLRAFGAGGAAVRRLLAGAVIALVLPAAVLGIVIERLVLGPALSRLAASYVTLPLARRACSRSPPCSAGLALAGGDRGRCGWRARRRARRVVAGLRREP